jgi:hypothetical protein
MQRSQQSIAAWQHLRTIGLHPYRIWTKLQAEVAKSPA